MGYVPLSGLREIVGLCIGPNIATRGPTSRKGLTALMAGKNDSLHYSAHSCCLSTKMVKLILRQSENIMINVHVSNPGSSELLIVTLSQRK